MRVTTVWLTGCLGISEAQFEDRLDWDDDGFVAAQFEGDDCDDRDPVIYPGAPDEWYDDIDSDCDGADDFDQDADGYRSDDHGGADCNDADPDVHPGADEGLLDGVDSNCDGNDAV